jgi:hypothetical protein
VQVDLRESWWIGPVEIPTRLVLAPMAGVSVQAFRRQGRRYGAGLVCSEMVSCAGLEHRNERTLGYLRVGRDEHPLAIQIFGSEPGVMADAARMVVAAGADIVDINFGCPVRKVTKTGAGATLLDDPEHATRIVAAVAGAVDIPVSVKMRRGLKNGSRTCLEVGPRLVSAGAQTSSGQLTITMNVQSSISLIFQDNVSVGTSGFCPLTNANTNNVGLDLGTAAFPGNFHTSTCVNYQHLTAAFYEVSSAFDVVVTKANSSSPNYRLAAQISTPPPASGWSSDRQRCSRSRAACACRGSAPPTDMCRRRPRTSRGFRSPGSSRWRASAIRSGRSASRHSS